MGFSDGLFNHIQQKTNVDKNTIMELARELQQNDLKNENTLRDVIRKLSQMTGRDVTAEQENKIINAVINDNVPKDVDKFF